MLRAVALALSSIAAATTPAAATAGSAGLALRATVPVHCSVEHQFSGYGTVSTAGVTLGQIREFCNAPRGYQLIVTYTPGALQGATISVGEDTVVLDGSGQAVLSRAAGPRMRQRIVTAVPGAHGFDSHQLLFQIHPI